MPKEMGLSTVIVTQRSPATYEVAIKQITRFSDTYHSSALRPCMDKGSHSSDASQKGRSRKDNSAGSSSRTIPRNQRGSVTNVESTYAKRRMRLVSWGLPTPALEQSNAQQLPSFNSDVS
ncbi:hypothetical protein TNIN_171501 [Trichonephila inaurata madagascariensis]|uniref:Uncharacterized protein n=1 Tax=Trichonephila inaurata madagascariensis TaxID=2747483 RepID=A0A8X7CIX2_9ARAC|nr:hypothetical protein TNIN_171501 [Trichonephila inaurata madagascariensis]